MAKGKEAELYVMSLFSQLGFLAEENIGEKQRKFYDLIIEGKWFMEVKYDLYAEKSGNLAIEVLNSRSNSASGLTVTKAHFWVHVLANPDTAYICPVVKLKEFVDKTKPKRIVDKGGDKNAMLMLYDKNIILQSFQKIEDFKTKVEFEEYAQRNSC